MKYKTKAKKLLECGFWVAGLGHFTLSEEEIAYLLGLIEQEDFIEIKKLYERLSKIYL